MADKIVGEPDRPFVKGSSKPKEEEVLETKLRSMITSNLIFKEGNNVLNVVDIKLKEYLKHKRIDGPRGDYNYEFEGDADIGIKVPNGVSYTLHSFRGYFLSDDEKEINSLFDEIQITK
ncbi:MAG: hypothetical protein J6W03_07500 [Bacteroidaceae bacterium]|nr:hypothetical protein [Bacteroidaceae bacterium]